MKTATRIKLDMAGRALEFSRAHPDQNPSTALVATHLGDLVERANTLAQQHHANTAAVAGAVTRKNQLRDLITVQLTALAGTSKVAAVTKPDLTLHRRQPRTRVGGGIFLTIARVAVAEATANRELFLKSGMPADLLETLTAELDEYEQLVAQQRNAAAAHVGAAAELESVTTDIMGVIRHLDVLNRLRFRGQAELIAAWRSARNATWPLDKPVPSAGTPGEEQAA